MKKVSKNWSIIRGDRLWTKVCVRFFDSQCRPTLTPMYLEFFSLHFVFHCRLTQSRPKSLTVGVDN